MAWRSKGGKGAKGKQDSKRAKAGDEETEYLKAVDPRRSINKAALRAYASPSQSDTDFLSLKNILAKMEPYTSSLLQTAWASH